MRRRRSGGCAFGAAIVLVLLSASSAAAEAAKPEFAPSSFDPGEVVRATLLLPDLGARESFRLERGQGLPEGEDPELLDLELAKAAKGWELRVRFVPWSPGPGRIPPLSIRGLGLPPITYTTGSRVGAGEREVSPSRPQREPPGTALYLYGIAGAAIVFALGLFASLAWLLPAARAALERWQSAQAFRRLCDRLDFLAAGAAEAEPADFYAALARAFRLYLGERIEEAAPALTATELAAMPSSAFPATGLRDEAAGILFEADSARYAGARPGAAAMAAAARRAREMARAAEEALDARL